MLVLVRTLRIKYQTYLFLTIVAILAFGLFGLFFDDISIPIINPIPLMLLMQLCFVINLNNSNEYGMSKIVFS